MTTIRKANCSRSVVHLDKEQESNVKQIDNEETEIIVKQINCDVKRQRRER